MEGRTWLHPWGTPVHRQGSALPSPSAVGRGRVTMCSLRARASLPPAQDVWSLPPGNCLGIAGRGITASVQWGWGWEGGRGVSLATDVTPVSGATPPKPLCVTCAVLLGLQSRQDPTSQPFPAKLRLQFQLPGLKTP